MSITTNIDGTVGGGANQLLDLLSLVSNPAVYEAKVKALQTATAENKKYVEAVAPVAEILDLREKVTADKIASTIALSEANTKASQLVAEAQANANNIIAEANTKASQLIAEAQATKNETKAIQTDARKKVTDATKAKAEYEALTASLTTQQAQLLKAQTDANTEKKSYEDLKAELINKHQEFIKSL